MACPQQPELDGADEGPEPLIAYVYGETAPDLAAIVACGFGVVCLDLSASWCTDTLVAEANAHGLIAVAFRMGYLG